ncbi:MAG: DUF1874 domain-containing protein [Brevinematia bacterium]
MIYITNAFSLSMLSDNSGNIEYRKASVEEVREILASSSWTSAVGHEGTAEILKELLGIEVPFNRIQISDSTGDILVVFQILKRLPEGTVLTKEEIQQLPYCFYIVNF